QDASLSSVTEKLRLTTAELEQQRITMETQAKRHTEEMAKLEENYVGQVKPLTHELVDKHIKDLNAQILHPLLHCHFDVPLLVVIQHMVWLVIAVGLVRAYLARGSYHGLYYSIEKPLKFFQTGALLEPRPMCLMLLTFFLSYPLSRLCKCLSEEHIIFVVQSEDSVLLFVTAWTVTEIIRYSFYTFSLLNHLPYLIKWARYTFFIVLYPMGVSGELLTIYAALPYVQKTGLYSVTLPNKYNFSFDYYSFLILVMISYIPRE
ncbi:Very-long-chain (3R)-3-hydroxyacyl-CoA dehydratase 2, partial [Goodea atripinnis]